MGIPALQHIIDECKNKKKILKVIHFEKPMNIIPKPFYSRQKTEDLLNILNFDSILHNDSNQIHDHNISNNNNNRNVFSPNRGYGIFR